MKKYSNIIDIAKIILYYPLVRLIYSILTFRKTPLFWYYSPNWGDALNPWLVSRLSGKKVYRIKRSHYYIKKYFCIGSILGNANINDQVWGSGFIREDETLKVSPSKIHAVRGPLTRKSLIESGINCPEVYGDPALLVPLFFNPDVPKKYNIGIIPHYVDKDHSWILRQRNQEDICIIDIESEIEEFICQVKSCNIILSSSLHGLICADSYGIPNVWIQLSDNVIGGHFKFRDYRSSIGASKPFPVQVLENLTINEISNMAQLHPVKLDLRKLLEACPFWNGKNYFN
jgi:pyruvyltransferase